MHSLLEVTGERHVSYFLLLTAYAFLPEVTGILDFSLMVNVSLTTEQDYQGV